MKIRTLLTIAAAAWATGAIAEATKTNVWEHSAAIGATINDGNTDSKQGTASWLSEIKTDSGNKARLALDAAHGENNGEKTADNFKGNANYKRMFAERCYGVGDINALYDSVADINYRITLSPGAGYYLMKSDAATLTFDLGPAYVWEKVAGVEDDYLAARAGERYERVLSAGAKVWQALNYVPQLEDFDNYFIEGEVGAEAAMTDTISLRLVFKDQYKNIPAEGRDRNDIQFVGAIAYKI